MTPDKLEKEIKEDNEYTVKLTCKLSKKKFVNIGSEAGIAEVTQIEFYKDGKVAKTLK